MKKIGIWYYDRGGWLAGIAVSIILPFITNNPAVFYVWLFALVVGGLVLIHAKHR